MERTEEKQENKKIRQTKRELFWEIFRFLLVGGLATVVDYVVSALFHGLVLPPKLIGETWSLIISTALGFSAGLLVNWFLSLAFVFKAVRDKKQASSKKSFLVYCVVCLIGLAISLLGMQLVQILPNFPLFGVKKFLGSSWTWWLMKIALTLIVLIWNYVGRKFFVFKS
jgi:putative flippase GtrA